jgi:leucyl aminopeptidase (aminopeptidase T)
MTKELIDKITRASGVKEGELVLVHFWGEDDNIAIMHQFAEAITALGASPLELQQSRMHNHAMFSQAGESSFQDKYFSMLGQVDAVLDVFTYQPVILGAKLSDEQMNLYRAYVGRLFQILMGKKRFTQIRIPTVENAQETNLEPEEFILRMEKAYDIDYDRLKKICEEKEEKLANTETIILETNNQCQLKLSFRNRVWVKDCGDGDWPCGEIYAAPVEEETEGKVYYETLYLEDIGYFEKVTLTVEHGIITSADQTEVQEFLNSLSKEEKTVCELGFGCNENVTDLCGYAVLDEKMNETFHLAIGNNTMFGGNNEANMHMDMVNKGTYIIKIQK